MRVAFRLTKRNRYSLVPLISVMRERLSGVEISVVDLAGIKSSFYDVLFYSFMSPDVSWVRKEVREVRSNCRVLIAGGAHPTAKPYETLGMGFDAVVVGEGEWAVLSLVSDFVRGRLERIYKRSCSFLDYTLEGCPYTAPVEIVRGCVHRCAFCQVPRLFAGVKHRSVASVLREARILAGRGRKFMRFIAPNALSYMSYDGVTPNVKALKRLFEGIAGCGIDEIYFGSFPSEVRPESVTVDAARLMSDFCSNRKVVVGAQSGSDRRLAGLRRGHTVKDVVKAVEVLNRFGFKVVLDFIFGFPGESHDEQRETLDFIEYLVSNHFVSIHAHTFIPLPGTPLERAEPAPIPRWLRARLHELEREGLLDGYWHKQEKMRGELWKEMAS
ncbi:MAG: TIGR04013 family B12-binding domain/radical SAM domain-containing protein [Deferribacteres bacterium]|nr:TIGR04013 family B12-binding domain/radical SAM domain-containing protein [Deferribacteres bacterium]